jgi:hypothetical protein
MSTTKPTNFVRLGELKLDKRKFAVEHHRTMPLVRVQGTGELEGTRIVMWLDASSRRAKVAAFRLDESKGVVGVPVQTVLSLLEILTLKGLFCNMYNLCPFTHIVMRVQQDSEPSYVDPAFAERYYAVMQCIGDAAKRTLWLYAHAESLQEGINPDTARGKRLLELVTEALSMVEDAVKDLDAAMDPLKVCMVVCGTDMEFAASWADFINELRNGTDWPDECTTWPDESTTEEDLELSRQCLRNARRKIRRIERLLAAR